jgi:hypothetical protein
LLLLLLQVREGLTAWLSWLHTHLGFEGWRFDHAIGYSSRCGTQGGTAANMCY